eukprot:TRINITY_DN165490_c0_g1_i1.p2 TRINITY_DN165490_c0_g1~~TRINITY_DN165490_c0_g1_i1.p2  ORF type:complete len:161 (-),score=9.70 TRINITY_DN165490_c0_g1_i1:24-467(-)
MVCQPDWISSQTKPLWKIWDASLSWRSFRGKEFSRKLDMAERIWRLVQRCLSNERSGPIFQNLIEKYPLVSLEDIMEFKFKVGTVIGAYHGEEFARLIKNPNFEAYVEPVSREDLNQKTKNKKRMYKKAKKQYTIIKKDREKLKKAK